MMNEQRTTKNEERRSSTTNEEEERRAKDGGGERQKETALPRKANGWRYKIGIKHKTTAAAKEASTQRKKRRDWNSFGLDEVVLKIPLERCAPDSHLEQAASREASKARTERMDPGARAGLGLAPRTTLRLELAGYHLPPKGENRARRADSRSGSRVRLFSQPSLHHLAWKGENQHRCSRRKDRSDTTSEMGGSAGFLGERGRAAATPVLPALMSTSGCESRGSPLWHGAWCPLVWARGPTHHCTRVWSAEPVRRTRLEAPDR